MPTSVYFPNETDSSTLKRPLVLQSTSRSGGQLVRFGRGYYQIVGLVLLGLLVGGISEWMQSRLDTVATRGRVVFSFPGFERGEYPDRSRFHPDDLRAPRVVAEAIKRAGLIATDDLQNEIRYALNIEGVVSPNTIRERDRIRASGQTPPAYIPDEYLLSLSLPPNCALLPAQRIRLLNEIVSVFRDNFRQTYAQVPISMGGSFDQLQKADFADYELILNTELTNIKGYLSEKSEQAAAFRSPSTGMSFKDLVDQTELFVRIQMNEAIGLIHEYGLSRDRSAAVLKINYRLRLLENRERLTTEEENVIKDLMVQSQGHNPNYAIAFQSRSPQNRLAGPALDEKVVEILMAGDAYNLLVRRALDTGLKVNELRSEKARLTYLKDNLNSFLQNEQKAQSAVLAEAEVEKSLSGMKANYQDLIQRIQKTCADFAQQHFDNPLRLSDEIRSDDRLTPIAIAASVGALLGLALGVGLSLLGISIVGSPSRQLA
jgi:ElaB/YqjD/DUF883 family membrane-anchored ribosome-binding protein